MHGRRMPRPSVPNVILGEVLRRLREDRGLSQEELAHRAKLHRNYIGFVERAERNPSWNNVARIAEALDVSMTELARKYDAQRQRTAKPTSR
jgi:transcriptional regulator with XRE-family HTH domain